MINFHTILEFDKEILLALNGSDSIFWDTFMWIYTGKIIWIPLVAVLLYIIFRNKGFKSALLVVVMVALVITLADQLSSGFFKPYFQRFRPTQDPYIMYLVEVVNGYRGGKYGFISSHAANSFGIMTFITLLVKMKELTYTVFAWAIINCFSRIYLGVHYLGDILAGIMIGCLIGFLVYCLHTYLNRVWFSLKNLPNSDKYSESGYQVSDVSLLVTVLFSSFLLIIFIGMFWAI